MADPHTSAVASPTLIRHKDTASSLLAAFSPTRAATSPAQKSPSRPDLFATPKSLGSPARTPRSPQHGAIENHERSLGGVPGSNTDSRFPQVPHQMLVERSRPSSFDHAPQTPPRQVAPDACIVSPPPSLPETPASQASIEESISAPQTDSRSAGHRSLRARQNLPLSTKAKANIDRGFKDPRKIQTLTPTAAAPPKSQSDRSKQEQQVQRDILQRHNAFVWANRQDFLPLLPSEFNYIQDLDAPLDNCHISSDSLKFEDVKHYIRLTEQPNGIKIPMKEHQMEGLSFLVWLRANGVNGILGDEMGLGKTVQVLSLLQYIKERNHDPKVYKPSIVVCPLSVLDTWQSQAHNFSPGLTTMIVHAPIAGRKLMRARLRKAINDKSIDIVVLSYETYDSEQSALRCHKWSYAILDEGHKMKNANSQTAKALQSIAADYRLILTGTPIQNDLFELWSLLHWLLPRVFDANSQSLFENSFILSKRDGINVATIQNARKLLELLMLRRTKEDIQGDMRLPSLTQEVLSIPLTPLQRDIYVACMTNTSDTLNIVAEHGAMTLANMKQDSQSSIHDTSRHYRELLNLLMQLRKVSIHPYLLPGIQPDPYELGSHIYESSGKFLVLKTILTRLVLDEGKKVIIFSGFKGALDCTEDLLKTIFDIDFKFLRIDGDGGLAYRNLSVRLFQEDEKYPVMLATLRAGGFGLTLTAAQAVIFLDEDWNPQVTVQAAARAHRIGQTKPVTIYKLVSSGTVEVQMGRRIAKKMYLSAKVTDSFKHTNAECWNDDEAASIAVDGGSTLQKFSFSQLASIIRDGRDTISTGSISTDDMLEWSFEKIMSHCKETRTDAEIDEEDEQKWLQEREHTQTTMFEGVVHRRAKKKVNEEAEASALHSPPAARRSGKETTVIIDGFTVSKSSVECGKWEAVPTLAGKDASLRDKKRNKRPEFGHIETCSICHGEKQGSLVHCRDCPKAYHQSCADDSKILDSAIRHARQCPAHKCCKCMQTASNCGGLLYKCTQCPRAFCEDHVEFDSCKPLGFELKQFADLGFINRQKEFFIECKMCIGMKALDEEQGAKLETNTLKKAEPVKHEQQSGSPPKSGGKRKKASEAAGAARTKRARGESASWPIVIDSD